MDFKPASTDMAGYPFVVYGVCPESRRTRREELNGLATKTHAFFRTETYGFGANLISAIHQMLRIQMQYGPCTD
jgi:hypothetical protein